VKEHSSESSDEKLTVAENSYTSDPQSKATERRNKVILQKTRNRKIILQKAKERSTDFLYVRLLHNIRRHSSSDLVGMN
jgi:hypothetical protein